MKIKCPYYVIHIDDGKEATHTLSVLLLDEALQTLIKNKELDKEKLASAIDVAKDKALELNKDNEIITRMSLVVNATILKGLYLTM